MFDALNGHFGDDVEWGMVAYPPIIISSKYASEMFCFIYLLLTYSPVSIDLLTCVPCFI